MIWNFKEFKFCGNGIVDDGETCDDAKNPNSLSIFRTFISKIKDALLRAKFKRVIRVMVLLVYVKVIFEFKIMLSRMWKRYS